MPAKATISLPRPHSNQALLFEDKHRFIVASCGRRFGKTEVAKLKAIEALLHGKRVWWLAPTYQMASRVWREIKNTTRNLPRTVSESERTLTFGSGFISVRSTHDRDNLRGEGLDVAILDECAYMHPDVWLAVVRPMLLESKGSALFLSTPNGRNHFYDLYRLGLDDGEKDWISYHFTTFDNPFLDRDELEAIRRNTPERTWREEYLAEFLDDGGSVFRKVRENATIRPQSRVYDDSHVYVMGVDWARDNDYTVIAVIDVTTSEMVDIDRFNQINWNLQRSRIEAMAARWRPDSILAEANSIGAPNIEELQASGLAVRAFMTTAKSKPVLIDKLAAALENNELSLLDDEYLVNELMAYTMERLPGGSYRYNAPAGQHDDTVIATALAWKAASGMAWVTEFT